MDNCSYVRGSRTKIYLLAGAFQINFAKIHSYSLRKSTFLQRSESPLKPLYGVGELVIFDKTYHSKNKLSYAMKLHLLKNLGVSQPSHQVYFIWFSECKVLRATISYNPV